MLNYEGAKIKDCLWYLFFCYRGARIGRNSFDSSLKTPVAGAMAVGFRVRYRNLDDLVTAEDARAAGVGGGRGCVYAPLSRKAFVWVKLSIKRASTRLYTRIYTVASGIWAIRALFPPPPVGYIAARVLPRTLKFSNLSHLTSPAPSHLPVQTASFYL